MLTKLLKTHQALMKTQQIKFLFLTLAAQERHLWLILFLLFHFVLAAVMCRFPAAESRELLEEVQALNDILSPPFESDSIFFSLQRSH